MIDIKEDISYMPEGWTGHLVGTQETIDALRRAHEVQPFGHVLEFGFNSGWSAALFLTLFPACKITSIEINQDQSAEQGVKILKEKFPNRHAIIWSDSTKLEVKDFKGIKFDTAFIDGGHDADTVHKDIALCTELGIKNYIFDDGNNPEVAPTIQHNQSLTNVSKNPYPVIRYKHKRYRSKGRTSSLDHYQIK